MIERSVKVERDRAIWAEAFMACVKSMPEHMWRSVYQANKDIFKVCKGRLVFTKQFKDAVKKYNRAN